MNLCPATHPDTGAQCFRWDMPAAHVIDDSHQTADGRRWTTDPRPAAGELYAGFGGLALAVSDVFGARTAWVVEKDPAASRVLEARFGVPNHEDVTVVDWRAVEPVSILAGGYPCQGESNAGKRLGDADPRWMWPAYRDAVAVLRPKLAVGENVRSHLGRSFRHVVADLLGLGYVVVWGVVAASDVGACHERKRLWWLAWPAEYGPPAGLGAAPFAHLEGGAMVADGLFGDIAVTDWPVAGAAYAGAAYAGAAYGEPRMPSPTAALGDPQRGAPTPAVAADRFATGRRNLDDAVALLPTPNGRVSNEGEGVETWQARADRAPGGRGMPLSIAAQLLPTPIAGAFSDGEDVQQWEARRARQAERGINGNGMGTPLTIAVQMLPTPNATDAKGGSTRLTHQRGNPTLLGAVQPERFGPYAAAVARWASLTRPAPDPTVPGRDGKPRLNPAFAEWLMGAPAGHITDVDGVSRNDALRIAGNGVVRQQGVAALAWLAGRLPAMLRAELALDLAPDDAEVARR